MRPGVWHDYQSELSRDWDNVQTQGGLRRDWEAACKGETGIDCFDHWARELVETGYLHNHARMWFASIWIFTLRLPWALGADFFLRHLLDGDPASNTLSWRWVGGIQTRGKTYLARASNIARYTEGRFNPKGLASEAPPMPADPPPDRQALPLPQRAEASLRTGFLLHSDDLSPGYALAGLPRPAASACLRAEAALTPLQMAPHISAFHDAVQAETVQRYADTLAPDLTATTAQEVTQWAKSHDLEQLVTPYAPVGPVADLLTVIERDSDLPVIRLRRDYDSAAWPHATHGFFRFKEKIPKLVANLKGLRAA